MRARRRSCASWSRRRAASRARTRRPSSPPTALHAAILACARNALLAEVYDHLGRALKLSTSPQLWDLGLAAKEIGLHEALVDAIAKGDAVRAESAATSLVESLRAALLPAAHKARAAR
jgi:DNA-binding FadR family transcriptional regulator